MRNYFIHDGNQKTGPFTIDEINQKRIEANTMIWFDGIDNWTEAKNIPELLESIIKSPPPLEKSSHIKQTLDKTKKILETDFVDEIENKIPNKKGKMFFKWTIVVCALVGLFFIGKNLLNKGNLSLFKGNAIDSLVIINPLGAARVDYYDKDKMIIEISCEMLNKSSVCSYKDFVVEVKYLTETKTLVETKQYTVYQTIRPFDKIPFNARLDDESIKRSSYLLQWKLIDATQIDPKKETE